MITADGWHDWAIRMPGPPLKTFADINANQGVVFHSAVGSAAGVVDVVFDPNNPRSVTGVNCYDGRLIQFYPLTASPFANGNHTVNRLLNGYENEGGAPGNESEPLREPQVETLVRILRDLAEWKGRPLTYWRRPVSDTDLAASLYEHREMVRFPPAGPLDHSPYPTACPSGRIPWAEIQRHLSEETRMIRLNGISAWYEDQAHQIIPAGETRGVNARLDFGLPAEAVAVQVEAYIFPDSGTLEIRDGFEASVDGPYAFQVERPTLYFAGLVNLSDGWFTLKAPGHNAHIRRIGVVGYWR